MNATTPVEILEQHGHLIVSEVAGNLGDPVSVALLSYVRSWRASYTLAQWAEELKKLDSCHETLESWLQTCWM